MSRLLHRLSRTFHAVWSQLFGHDVFISYARRESRGLARRIETLLKRRGFTVFRDYSGLTGGDAYRRKLRDAAARCRLHVLLLGDKAVASPWVNKEVNARWAYVRLLKRRRSKQKRPFFPVFDQSLDWSTARPRLRQTQGFHGFPINRPGRAVAEWDALAVAGAIEATFHGWRARKVWRLAGATLAIALLALVALSGWLHLSAQWRQQSLAWQSVAESAEAGRRYLEAEMAWSRAVAADERTRAALTPRYQSARAKRLLSPAWHHPAPHLSLQWIGQSAGLPVLVMRNADLSQLTFHRQDGRAVTMADHENSSPHFLQSDHGIVALVGESLTLVNLDAPVETARTRSLLHGMTMGVWQAGFEPPEMRRKGHTLHLLGKANDVPTVLQVDLASWTETQRVPLDVSAKPSALRIAETDAWLAAGASIDVTGPHPLLHLSTWDSAGNHVRARANVRLPDDVPPYYSLVSRVAPSLDDKQLFVELRSRHAESNPYWSIWIGIELSLGGASSRLAYSMGSHVNELKPLYVFDDSEAVFSNAGGEVRLLTWYLPLLYPRTQTLMPRTHSWAILNPGKGMQNPVRLATFQNQRLQLLHGAEPVLEISDPALNAGPYALNLAASEDGAWLAADSRPSDDTAGTVIQVWRASAPPPVDCVPSPEALEQELSPPLPRPVVTVAVTDVEPETEADVDPAAPSPP